MRTSAAWTPASSNVHCSAGGSSIRTQSTLGRKPRRIPLKRGDAKAALPERLAGTLVLTETTGGGEVRQAFDVSAKLDPAFVPAPSLGASFAAAEGIDRLSLAQALLFALLGGLILNLMPCVFPVLAMKAAAFARLAGHARSEMRRDGIAYTMGVLASFAAMAAIVVGLRSSLGEVIAVPSPTTTSSYASSDVCSGA